jgi:hypothetical protein
MSVYLSSLQGEYLTRRHIATLQNHSYPAASPIQGMAVALKYWGK